MTAADNDDFWSTTITLLDHFLHCSLHLALIRPNDDTNAFARESVIVAVKL